MVLILVMVMAKKQWSKCLKLCESATSANALSAAGPTDWLTQLSLSDNFLSWRRNRWNILSDWKTGMGQKPHEKTAIMQLPWEKWGKMKNVNHKAQFSVVDIWRQTGAHFSLAFCWWVESGKSVKANIFQNCPRLIIGCQNSSAAATIKNQDTMVTYHAWRHCSSNGAVW